MFGSWVLDVAIGLVVVFILFSTICASVREGLEACMKTRAAFLERGIRELLNDKDGTGLNRQLYDHPLIFSLFSGDYENKVQRKAPSLLDRGDNLPSYIPSRSFALALVDLVARGPVPRPYAASSTPQLLAAAPTTVSMVPALPIVPGAISGDNAPISLDSLRARAGNIGNDRVARVLLNAIDTAGGDLDVAINNIERWFDSTMERVSGWYRRKTNLIVFFLGLVLAVGLNIDTLAIAGHLYRNQDARASLVGLAEDAQRNPAALTRLDSGIVNSPLVDESLQLPLGWSRTTYANPWYMMGAGWLITAFAATLGAPFWFDILSKLMAVRSTIKSKKETAVDAAAEPATRPVADRIDPPPPPSPALSYRGQTDAPASDRRRTAQIAFDTSTATTDADGCGHIGRPQTDDKDLPSAQGGMQ
jgi:hypothetical protein